MTDSKPRISVIIPVYNAALYIAKALQSAEDALNGMSYEFIVVNDGSTDDTEQALAPWMSKISYYTQNNQGAAAARNSGLSHAQGAYIACMDADDIWPQDRMRILMDAFEKHSHLDIAVGRLQRFSDKGSRSIFFSEQAMVPSFGSSIIRATAFQRVGMIEGVYRFHEDVDWFLRAIEQGLNIADVARVVSYYRIHESNTTKALTLHDKSLLKVLAASLKRRKFRHIESLRDIGI